MAAIWLALRIAAGKLKLILLIEEDAECRSANAGSSAGSTSRKSGSIVYQRRTISTFGSEIHGHVAHFIRRG